MTDEDMSIETREAPKEEWGNDISPDQDGKLFKKIIQEGIGEGQPKKGDEVFVHYTGRLLDGTVFDSSVERNELFNFKLGEGKVNLVKIHLIVAMVTVARMCNLINICIV